MKTKIQAVGAETTVLESAHQPTTIASYALPIAQALEASGVDSTRIFQSIGIPSDLVTAPLNRLPTTTIARLFRACVEATNNPYFGLTVARFILLTHFHALGYSLAASSTLLDFCRRLERYFRLVSHVAKISVTLADDKVLMRLEYPHEVSGETEDAFFAFLIKIMRMLYKPEFNPIRLELHRAMPLEGAEPYEALFRAPVSFSNATSLLVLDKASLLQRLDGSNPELAQVHDDIVISYLARLDKSDVITGVIQKIIELLAEGDCSRDKVASALCMSSTNLQLKLSKRGMHFQQLLDDTRKELACSYLRHPSRSVTEITFLLGFSDTSNFTRAFKRWTGLSTKEFRFQL